MPIIYDAPPLSDVDFRKSLLRSMSAYAQEHYPNASYGVYPIENDSKLAIVLVANKYSPNNFWQATTLLSACIRRLLYIGMAAGGPYTSFRHPHRLFQVVSRSTSTITKMGTFDYLRPSPFLFQYQQIRPVQL